MKRVFIFVFIILFIFYSTEIFAARVSVNKLSAYKIDQKVRVIIHLDQSVNYSSFTLDNPKRFVIDLKDTNIIQQKKLPNFTHVDWIQSMRVAPNRVGVQRIVFTLTKSVASKIEVLRPVKDLPWRMVIDLTPGVSAVAPSVGNKKSKSKNSSQPSQQQKKTAQITSEAVISKTADELDKKVRCVNVVIDPGHGGKDTGAIGLQGIKEKDVVLSIGNYLKAMLKNTPGFCAYMTRDSDYFISLRGRLAIARKDNADLFVAIHADIFHDPRAKGASVFALSSRGATSESARWLAQRENTSELLGGAELDDKSEKLRSVLLSLSQHATSSSSLELGKDVLDNLNIISHLHHPSVEQAGFVVLKSPDIPSVLVETGFLSNPEEEAKLSVNSYRQKIAKAIYDGILEYVYAHPPDGSSILAWEREKARTYVVKSGDNLSVIAEKFQTSVKAIMSKNKLKTQTIYIGQKLEV